MRLARSLLALLLTSCTRDQPEPDRARPAEPVTASAAVLASAAQDTLFRGTTAPLHRSRPGRPPRVHRAARPESHAGYDRILFEFAGDSLPGYHIEYTDRPVRRCGSGDLVSLAGTERLVVRFDPARAHDDSGNPTVTQRESTPGLPVVKEMKLVCDFEGQVEWALGVAAAHPYRVLEASGPTRLILDVRHGP